MEATTLADRVYENLKQRILNQEFECGTRLNIAAITKDLHVSNTPVREAISRLEKVGLVKIVPYRGPFVRSLSVSETAEVYDVRISLEVLAARLATLHATPESLALIKQRLREHEEARKGSNLDDSLLADLRFHESIAQASCNRTLIDMLAMLTDWTLLMIQYSIPRRQPLVRVKDATHQCILKAIRSGDKEAAAAAMRKHLVAGKNMVLKQIEEEIIPTDASPEAEYVDVWASR